VLLATLFAVFTTVLTAVFAVFVMALPALFAVFVMAFPMLLTLGIEQHFAETWVGDNAIPIEVARSRPFFKLFDMTFSTPILFMINDVFFTFGNYRTTHQVSQR